MKYEEKLWGKLEKIMTATAGILPYVLLAPAYLGLGWLAWRDLSQVEHQRHPALASGGWLTQAILAVLLVWHAMLLRESVWIEGAINFSVASALSAVTWLMVLLLWAGNFWHRFAGVGALLLPVAAVCALLPPLDRHPHWLRYLDQPWAALHVAVALVAFSLFAVAALQAVLLMSVEKRLHSRQSHTLDQSLPPLLTLERFLFRLIGVAFVLLTLTILSGAFFSEELFHQPFRLSHKIVFTMLAWGLFAGLLYGRSRYGWRGRVALRWILIGSAMLLIAYAGSKFVLEILLGR
jgi:ABC-type uncharacterized transport system permease subunit